MVAASCIASFAQVAPRVRVGVVAAEHQRLKREACARGQRLHLAAEVDRRHAGITTVMLDLVAGVASISSGEWSSRAASKAASSTSACALQTE